MRKGLRSTGVAVGVLGLVLGTMAANPAMASPDDELIWEQGAVTSVADGDTITANLTSGSGVRGEQRIRTIGVQAPEVAHTGTLAECGSAQSTQKLQAVLPTGAPVQTRSVQVTSNDDYSGGRIVRSLYAQDEEGNWYDSSRGTVSDGWLLWFPLSADSSNKPEWAHNLEYRVLADDAATRPQGLWTPDLCGGPRYPDMNIRLWAKYYGTERVYVENNSPYDIDLSGWILRDSAISAYKTLPAGTVITGNGGVREIFTGDLNLNNLPATNNAFEGDAAYLMEPAGGGLGTGNLRAWFPYPCNPDSCADPLTGKVSITKVQEAAPPFTAPSAPGSVAATASTDGSGNVAVTWAPPTDLGGPGVTYTVGATSSNGGTVPSAPATGITGTAYTVPGLTLGRAYSFTVTAVQGAVPSPAVSTANPVTPLGIPGVPTNVIGAPRDQKIVTSWAAPALTGGSPVIKYVATATPVGGGTATTCTSDEGATSCVIPGVGQPAPVNGTPYTITVRAVADGLGQSAESEASQPVAPNPYEAGPTPADMPGAPTDVVASPGDSRAVVSWAAPADDGGHPIILYTVTAAPKVDGTDRTCTTADELAGATSCVVTGLENGTQYTFSVTATNDANKTSSQSAVTATATPTQFVPGLTAPATAAPPLVLDPWVGGQSVDLANTSGSTVRLGGYGFWNTASSAHVNGGSTEDWAAYLFPADTTLAAGRKLRVHFGGGATPPQGTPDGVTRMWTTDSAFIGLTNDYVELANLTRAQVSCVPTPGGTCRGTKQQSISSPPVGVTARTTASSVAVAWGAPISTGGSPITGYTATAFDAPIGGNPISSCSGGGADRTCSFPGGIGSKYFVEVTASNALGTSGPSWRVLAAPKTVPSAPGSVAVSGTPGGVNVTWTPAAENGATITKYTASAYTAGTGGTPVGSCTTSNGSLLGCTIMKLQGGTQYYIDVTATNRAGNGAPSSPRTPGMPGPGGAVSTYSKGKVTVRWDPPTPGSNTITGYTAKLYTKSSGGTKVGECSAPAGKTSCTTKKMKKRSKYYIDLTMMSAAGTFTVKPRIVTGPAKKASAPKVTSATPSGRQVVISWAPPTFNGYSYLKGYGARLYSKSKGGSVKASCSAGPTTTTCTTKALKKKGTYYSAVRVKNSKGWSKWSKRVKVVVR